MIAAVSPWAAVAAAAVSPSAAVAAAVSPSATVASADTWHYAAWVAIDFRLLLFAALLAALTAAGIAALVVRSTRMRDYLATWVLAFIALFVVTVFFMNEVAHHPVFVVESLFPFP